MYLILHSYTHTTQTTFNSSIIINTLLLQVRSSLNNINSYNCFIVVQVGDIHKEDIFVDANLDLSDEIRRLDMTRIHS